MHVFQSTDRLSQEESRQRPVAADLGLVAVQILLQERPQILPSDELHLVVQGAVVLESAVQCHHTRMIQFVKRLASSKSFTRVIEIK